MSQLFSIEDLTRKDVHSTPKFALFELGFRPFFLLGGVFALLAVIPWVLALHGIVLGQTASIWWHAHEMIFGFALAIIYGFLLTAGQNWTGVASPRGLPLLILVLLWLLPRLGLAFLPQVPLLIWAMCDVLANLAVMAVMARMVFKAKQWRNAPFVLILAGFAMLNGFSYFTYITGHLDIATRIHDASLWVIAIVINLMGGRVIPAFTQGATHFKRPTEPIWLLRASTVALLLVALAWLIDTPVFLRMMSAITAGLLFYRWNMWGWTFSLKNPLLWSLHLSFVCLPIACGLIALGYPRSGALHVLTIGAVTGLIVSMMSRVSLGHTGRMLKAPRLMPWAFGLIACAALLRAVAAVWDSAYLYLIDGALLLWVLAFACFVWHYALILLHSRLDGKRG